MSILQNILGRIFGRDDAAAAAPAPQASAPGTPGTPAPAPATPAGAPQPSVNTGAAAQPATASAGTAPPPTLQTVAQPVDVEAVLTALAAKNPQTLNWRTSIVDLLKLLDMDNSLAERKALAKELSYPGDLNDSAAMNIWLHKAVMARVAENGGKVPDDLKD